MRIVLVELLIVHNGFVAKFEPTTTAQLVELTPMVTVSGRII